MSITAKPYNLALRWIVTFFLISVTSAAAQPFGLKKYTINDGLPDAYILNICQDSNGFLWFGTANGLCRFDGREFISYDFADGLPDEYVNKIIEDRAHRLWIGTRRGMVRMKGNKFIYYPYSDGKSIGFVFDIIETGKGEILGLTDQGVYRFMNEHWQKISLYPGLEDKHCRNIVETANGMIVNYGDYLVKIDSAGRNELLGKDTLNWPYYNTVRKYGDKIYMVNSDGVFITDNGHQQPLFADCTRNKKVLNFFLDSKNRSWVYFIKGGLEVSAPGNTSNFEQQLVPPDELVSLVYEDKLGIIWIASSNGLLRAEPRNYRLIDSVERHKIKAVRNIMNLPGKGIVAASEMDGLLSINGGVPVKMVLKQNPATQKSFAGSIIDGHCIDNEMRTWMVTRSGKLFMLENDQLRALNYGTMGNYGGFFDITFNPKSGNLFVSSDTLYTGNLLSFSMFRDSENGNVISFPVKVRSFTNGITLVGTRHNGILMIDSLSRVHPYSAKLNIPENSGQVNFYKESEDKFWISFSGGIKRYHWNEKKEPAEELLISEANGLPNNSVYSIAFDDHHRLWALTAAGLITITFDSSGNGFYLKRWNDADGIDPENLRGGNICKDDSGNIWVQLVDRMYTFDAEDIQIKKEFPQVVISNIQLNLQETDWNQWTDSLRGYLQIPVNPLLPSNRNSLGIFYKGISFRDYSGLEYTYKLNGDNNSWSPPQKSNFVSFVGLPPGKYEFMVKVKDSNAGWSEPDIFSFEILTPFWQKWWFILLIALLLGYLIFALFQFRLHEKLVVLNLRQKLHRDLHDDIGATLSSIKVYTEVLQDDPGNSIITGLIKENAEEMIGQLELIAWATNPQNDSFKSLCDLMKKYAIPACYAKKIDLSFSADNIQGQLMIPGNVRKNLFLVFKEAVNNVIKYSEASACAAEMTIRNHRFILQISDNGVGMINKGKEQGYGMQNMRKRAEELKGKLEVSSIPGKGVTVRMMIPFPFKIPYTWDERGKEYD